MRHTDVSQLLVDAARAGDQSAFAELAGPYRHELQVHCYRMLGSVEDAEDVVQETYLRAWTRLDSFAGRAPFRAWMYGIATHACLDALRRKKARVWPSDVAGPTDPNKAPSPPVELPWLQPYPDRLLPDGLLDVPAPPDAEPEAVVTSRETIELAFLAAIQRLSARQRAVLILRDVLEWPAKETADALEMTQAAVNSALQRARATLAQHLPERHAGESATSNATSTATSAAASNATEKALLKQVVAAWEGADTAALVGLLRADARLVMPPRLAWFDGRDAVETFLRDHVFGEMGTGWLLVPTAANRQPAFALYWREPGDAVHRQFAIVVLRVDEGAIGEIAVFMQPELFSTFALPATLATS